ncbi:MAG: hypothetical protein ACIARQ_01595 [Phycisphaerales bacterium JB061]|jgi:membrane protein implicated in regulation of membrane protease activity
MLDNLFENGGVWFTIPAIIGTVYFLFQIFLGGLGGDLDLGIDADLDFDSGLGGGDAPGVEVGVLSLQTLSAFFMASGWSGFAALRLLGMDMTGAVLVAVVAGVAFSWMLVWLMRKMLLLQNSGNVRIGQTVGLAGDVYIQVPPAGQGTGRVKLVLGTRQREFNAVQSGAEPIATNTRIRVVQADPTTNTLTVETVS